MNISNEKYLDECYVNELHQKIYDKVLFRENINEILSSMTKGNDIYELYSKICETNGFNIENEITTIIAPVSTLKITNIKNDAEIWYCLGFYNKNTDNSHMYVFHSTSYNINNLHNEFEYLGIIKENKIQALLYS